MVMENGNGNEMVPYEGETSVGDKDATQAVQVALNIRPLIAMERVQGCKDCITVVPGEPQVNLLIILDCKLCYLNLASI